MGRRRPQAPRHRRAGRLCDRAEDRRLGDLARLRARRLRARRDPRRRLARGGRHPEPPHDRGGPAARARRGDRPALLEVRARSTSRCRASRASTRRRWRRGRRRRRTPATRRPGRSASSTRGHRRRPLSLWVYGAAPARATFPRPSGRCSRGSGSTASARTRTPSGSRRSRRSPRCCRAWEARRGELDYEIDGIVIKVDDLDQQRRLGALHERPRWARAYKWAPPTAVTTLRKIHIRVGRTGALNPWASSSRCRSAASRSRPRRCTTRRTSTARTSARATS